MKTIGKLVRDKIPTIIEERGERAVTRTVTGEELRFRLEMKLNEEVAELLNAKDHHERIHEFADVYEVLEAIANFHNVDLGTVGSVKLEKYKRRGAFDNGVYLVGVAEQLTEEEKSKREEAEQLSRMMKNAKHSTTTITIGNASYELHPDGLKEVE